MSVELTVETSPETAVAEQWEPPMPPADLIFDDGEPLETNRHRIATKYLTQMKTAISSPVSQTLFRAQFWGNKP